MTIFSITQNSSKENGTQSDRPQIPLHQNLCTSGCTQVLPRTSPFTLPVSHTVIAWQGIVLFKSTSMKLQTSKKPNQTKLNQNKNNTLWFTISTTNHFMVFYGKHYKHKTDTEHIYSVESRQCAIFIYF